MRWRRIFVLGALLAGAWPGSGPAEPSTAGKKSLHPRAAPGENSGEGVVHLSPERLRLAGIVIAPVVQREFRRRIRATGKVEFNAERTARVGSRIPGQIVRIQGLLGERVVAGQELLLLDSVELGNHKAALRKAWAQLALKQKNYERRKRLFEARISSAREMAEAEAAWEEARIEAEAAEETLRILGVPQKEVERLRETPNPEDATLLPLRAPLAGTIVEKHALLGQRVDPANTLYLLSDLSSLWVEAHVYEQDLPLLRPQRPALVRVSAYAGESFPGILSYIGDTVDSTAYTVAARVEVANPEGKLRVGMFAVVEIATGLPVRHLAVPETAVQNEGDRNIVYVTSDGEDFQEREIRTGEKQDGYLPVLAGLDSGEGVVVRGGFFLKSEAAKDQFGDDEDD